jgi:hypothetical protein
VTNYKQVLFAMAIGILPMQAMSQTTFGSTTSLNSNVGSRITIQLQSNSPSIFSGTFAQSFTHLNGSTNFTRNFNFAGNMNYNITSTINTNTTVFTNNPAFRW